MKLVVISPKESIKYGDLINKLESCNAIFYENSAVDISEIAKRHSGGKFVLAIDELKIVDGYAGLNKNLDNLKSVRYICGLSARYHEFDLKKAAKLGITYCNNPDTNSQSVAEIAMMHMFNLIRYQPLYNSDSFDFYGLNHLGHEASSLSVGILGYGYIGRRIAKMCHLLGMKVKIWSQTKKKSPYQQVPLDQLLKQDVIFISIASNPPNKAFEKDFYQVLTPKQYVIDVVASDSLYNKNKLIALVDKSELAGFGFEAEHPSSNYQDSKGNISISPHAGWGTQESYRRWYVGWTKTIISAYKNQPINVVTK